MTGRIKRLNGEHRSGLIETPGLLKFSFDWSSVLMHDLAYLNVGQLVSFDLKSNEAVNICVQRRPIPVPADGKKQDFTFRYLGFDQTGGIRTHRFERTSFSESKMFLVHTDTAMFARLHIGIQEGPTLCQKLLTKADDDAGGPEPEQSLTEQHLEAYLASKPSPARRSPPKRAARQAT